MKAMVLAAGEGTRLRPLTNNIPKVMIKIGRKPLLQHNIELAEAFGVNKFYINVHFKSDKIIDYFESIKKRFSITYSKEKKLLGSAGGVKKLEKNFNEPFLLLYGDNFTNCDLGELFESHNKSSAICTIAIFDIAKHNNSGIAGGRVVINKDKSVRQFVEGGAKISNFVNAGVYVLDPKIFKFIPKNRIFDFGRDLFPLLLKKNIRINTYLLGKEEYVFGCDNLECYKKTKLFFKTVKSEK